MLEIELQLERLFIELMLRKRVLPGVVPRTTYNSLRVLSDHIRQGRNYAAWLPYDDTERRAKIYLRGGRPFTDLSRQGRKAFAEMGAIRNLLAHESNHSKVVFERIVLSERSVPTYERKVENYLTGVHASGESRLQAHMTSCVQAFDELL